MSKPTIKLLCFSALALLFSACGGKDGISMPDAANEHPGGAEPLFSISRQGFTVEVDPSSLELGGSIGSLDLRLQESEAGPKLIARASGARGLKTVYATVKYDIEQYVPVAAAAAEDFASSEKRLQLSMLDLPGEVQHGQVLIRPQECEGFSGDGDLFSVSFRKRRADETIPTALRRTSAPPTHPSAQSDCTAFLSTTSGVFWNYNNPGDYNEDGVVSVQDLTPIGIHFQKSGPFKFASIESVVDGNSDGHILISDLTPIGTSFMRRITSFNVYASNNLEDYNPDPASVSTIEPYVTVSISDFRSPDESFHSGPLPGQGRLVFGTNLASFSTSLASGQFRFYWVRPADGDTEGIPSVVSCDEVPYQEKITSPDEYKSAELKVLSPMGGSGDFSDPYILSPGGSYDLQYMHPQDGDVTDSPDMRWRVISPEGNELDTARVEDGMLVLDPDCEARLQLQAFYKGQNWGFGAYGNGGIIGAKGSGGPPNSGVNIKTNGFLQPPVLVSVVEPLSGQAPLTVSFDLSGSSDPDYADIRFFSSTGDFDDPVFAHSEPVFEYTYNSPGIYHAQVSVSGDYSQSSLKDYKIQVSPGSGGAPIVDLQTDKTEGVVPLEVNLDVSQTLLAPGATINKCEWDFDGDGTFDEDTGSVPQVSHTYTLPGFQNVKAKVTDSQGLSGEATIFIVPKAVPNDLPEIVLNAAPLTGSAPLMVDFDASASMDPDGSIVEVLWDFNGDHFIEVMGDASVLVTQHTYDDNGAYHVNLTVKDNLGGFAISEVVVRVGPVPTALLADFPTDVFEVPAEVTFDASGSSDVDGSIVAYHWDFDGDGTVDDTTTESMATHTFTQPTEFYLRARVTVEDNDGFTDYDETLVGFVEPLPF